VPLAVPVPAPEVLPVPLPDEVPELLPDDEEGVVLLHAVARRPTVIPNPKLLRTFIFITFNV
jgi:hypothetical protein